MRQNNNLKIAITGGIGSGKSTIARIIKEKGYPVFSCDETYAQLVKDKNFLKILADEFGDIYDENGELDRGKLSHIVFSDNNKLERLNEITHPKIFEKMFEDAAKLNCLCFFEVPLLFEEGNQKLFDGVIVVCREKDKRIESVMHRDNISEEEVRKRINSQYNYDNSNFAEYYVIHNNSNINNLQMEIDGVLAKILNK
jgi:dephospho-CoA kinase